MATRKSCFVLNGPNGSIKPCNFTTRRSTTTSFNCANQTLTYQLALAVVSMVAVDEVESNYWSTIIDWMRQCVSGDSSQKWMSATTPFICYNLQLVQYFIKNETGRTYETIIYPFWIKIMSMQVFFFCFLRRQIFCFIDMIWNLCHPFHIKGLRYRLRYRSGFIFKCLPDIESIQILYDSCFIWTKESPPCIFSLVADHATNL